jgi:hypothetical protein
MYFWKAAEETWQRQNRGRHSNRNEINRGEKQRREISVTPGGKGVITPFRQGDWGQALGRKLKKPAAEATRQQITQKQSSHKTAR